jgi:hypothetical protein
LIENGWDPVHAYLKLFLDLTKAGKPFDGITNKNLRDFGSQLKPYDGLPGFFQHLRKWSKEPPFGDLDIEISYYVVSGGFEEIIRGCDTISKNLNEFYGCRLAGDTPTGQVKYIMRAISFTEKTRYIFEIHKGILKRQSDKNPMLVNKEVKKDKRPVPFKHMIYVGDGLTDIPCLSLIKHNYGYGIAIMHKDSAKREVFEDLIKEQRATSYHSPNYKKDSDLTGVIKAIISGVYKDLVLIDGGFTQ